MDYRQLTEDHKAYLLSTYPARVKATWERFMYHLDDQLNGELVALYKRESMNRIDVIAVTHNDDRDAERALIMAQGNASMDVHGIGIDIDVLYYEEEDPLGVPPDFEQVPLKKPLQPES